MIAIGGSHVDKTALSPLLGHFPLIAADSGADTATTMGVMPDHIIGDFDSIGDMAQFPPDRLIHMAEQDSTDLEKTLSCLSVPFCLGFGFLAVVLIIRWRHYMRLPGVRFRSFLLVSMML